MTTETVSQTSYDAASTALVARLRHQWETVHAQWTSMPAVLRSTWAQVGDRIRFALDVPSKEELKKVSDRLEQFDARLAQLATPRPLEVEVEMDHPAETVAASHEAASAEASEIPEATHSHGGHGEKRNRKR